MFRRNITKQLFFSLILSGLVLGLFLIIPVLAQENGSVSSGSPLELHLNPLEDPLEEKESLSYEIRPTKTLEDVLTISNTSTTTSYRFKAYAVDSTQSTDGTAAFKLADAPQNHIGNWVKFDQNQDSIAPGQSIYLPYQINIPAKVSPGTYQGGLVIEIINPENQADQVKIVTRLVEPILISIPGRKEIEYTLDDFAYHQNSGKPSFFIKFTNKGNVFLTGEVNLKIDGTLLSTPYEISLNHPTILQGESFEKAFLFENPPLLGDYRANLEFKVFEYDVARDQLRLLETINREIRFGIIPFHAIFALIVLIVLAILGERWRQSYLKELNSNTFIHQVKKGETVLSIASLYQVNWRKIVKMNHLHRPYTLEPGDELILPFPKSDPPRKPPTKNIDKRMK